MTQKSKENWMDHPDFRAALQDLRSDYAQPQTLSALDKEQVQQQIALSLLAAPAVSAAEPASLAPSGGTVAGSGGASLLAGKLSWVIALAVTTGLVPAWLSLKPVAFPEPSKLETAAPPSRPEPPIDRSIATAAPVIATSASEPKDLVVAEPLKSMTKPGRLRALPRAMPTPGAGASLREEVELLRLARASLTRSPPLAREALKQYGEKFPTGVMRVEYEKLSQRLEAAERAASAPLK